MIELSRRSQIAPFMALDVLAKSNRLTASGHDVLSLAIGQPAAGVPQPVRAAAEQALRDGLIGYTDALGQPELRQAISDHYRDHYGLAVPASRIVITTGSSAGFLLAFMALSDAGGRIAITVPGYPAYRNIIRSLSLEPVELPTGGGALDVEALLAAHAQQPIKALLLASPANPTGTVASADELQAIIEACRQAGIAFVSDEIYHRLNYVGPDISALAFGDDAITINSFSKYYCMTGWRIGWMVLPEQMVRTIECLAQSLFISSPTLSQIAARHAFGCVADYEAIKDGYRANRALLMQRLPAMDIAFATPPDGTFYAWCDVSRHTNDSAELARRMLAEIHVATTPGADFDALQGGRYLRLSYAGSQAVIEEALERLQRWL